MTEPGSGWASPGGDSGGGPAGRGDWQAPSYPPAYPQAGGQAEPPAAAPPAAAGWQGWGPAWSRMPGVVPLRPLGVGELLDGGVKIIRRYPKPTLALSAVVSIVVTVMNVAFLLLFTQSDTLTTDSTSGSQTFGNSFNGASLPGTVLNFLGGIVLTGALVTVVSRAVLGRPATLGDAWQATRPRFWALLGVAMLRALLAAAPVLVTVVATLLAGPVALLLILPLIPYEIWLYTVTSMAPAALVLEKAGVVGALRRSRVLVMRSFWRILGILVLAGLITAIIQSILVIPVTIIAGASLISGGTATLGTAFFVVSAIASGIAQTLVAPYNAGLRALLYVDLRMRTEGLDVALQTAAATPAGSPSA
ncbi:MAG: hypothetical protein JWO27_2403 [Frankiales bacterium]|nr:hypothetical protein [Frankiales bacterium]